MEQYYHGAVGSLLRNYYYSAVYIFLGLFKLKKNGDFYLTGKVCAQTTHIANFPSCKKGRGFDSWVRPRMNRQQSVKEHHVLQSELCDVYISYISVGYKTKSRWKVTCKVASHREKWWSITFFHLGGDTEKLDAADKVLYSSKTKWKLWLMSELFKNASVPSGTRL